MADEVAKVPPEVLSALRGSGFPFQTAIERVVEQSPWAICAKEYPWRDLNGKDEFLDLVIRYRSFYAGLECKKTAKESLIFLRPMLDNTSTGEYDRVRCIHGRKLALFIQDWALRPESYESKFCVVSTGAKERLLERDARLVVLGTQAFALEQEHVFVEDREKPPEGERIYFCVIVTNAPIYTVRYYTNEVSLRAGFFEKDPKEPPQLVPWIRFRKSFVAMARRDMGDRTVFVVTAEKFAEFLSFVEKSPADSDQNRNSIRLRI